MAVMNSKLNSAAYRLAEVTPELPQGYWTGLYMSGFVGPDVNSGRGAQRGWRNVLNRNLVAVPWMFGVTPIVCQFGKASTSLAKAVCAEKYKGTDGCYACCCWGDVDKTPSLAVPSGTCRNCIALPGQTLTGPFYPVPGACTPCS